MCATTRPPSPRIASVEWGVIEAEGLGTFKDVKLWPGGGRAWDWGETGTRHVPGVQPGDVDELLAHGAEVVVLSRGMHLRLQCQDETLRLLEQRGVEVHRAETTEAVALYNRLVDEGRAAAGLFHSTC